MPSRLYNLARMTVASAPGTGNIALSAAVPGFINFAQAGVLNNAIVRYGAKDGNARETGYATYSSAGNGSLTARVIENSTNAGAALNLSAAAIISIMPSATDFGTIAPQCGRLIYSGGTQLTFQPFNGNKLKIAGKLYEIPAAGLPGLANTGIYINGNPGQNLIAGTVYNVTAFDSGGSARANFTTDASHAVSQAVDNEGVEYSPGMGQTHSIIGKVRTTGSALFENLSVLSWFNRAFKEYHISTGNVSTTYPTAYTPITPSYATLKWSDDPLWVMFSGQANTSHAPGGFAAIDIGINSVNIGLNQYVYYLAGAAFPVNLSGWYPAAEGYNTVAGLGVCSSGSGTLTVNNSVLGWGAFG